MDIKITFKVTLGEGMKLKMLRINHNVLFEKDLEDYVDPENLQILKGDINLTVSKKTVAIHLNGIGTSENAEGKLELFYNGTPLYAANDNPKLVVESKRFTYYEEALKFRK